MRIKGCVAYKGTRYNGWQKQVDEITIQGEIEKVLSQIFNTPISIFGSGRTDAGVHAFGQCFHFDIDKDEYDLDKLMYSMNMMLEDDIQILSLEKASDNFSARYDVKGKTYLYKIRFKSKDPFESEYAYLYPMKINIDLFKTAMYLFVGEHDFKNFTSKEEDKNNFIREIFYIDVIEKSDGLDVYFTGNGFMRYMIRFLVGTAINVANGKESLEYILNKLDCMERNIVSYKAPPQGLYLKEVIY